MGNPRFSQGLTCMSQRFSICFEQCQKPFLEPVFSGISQILNSGGVQEVKGSTNAIGHGDADLDHWLFCTDRGDSPTLRANSCSHKNNASKIQNQVSDAGHLQDTSRMKTGC
jgi:hypothetical protein